MKWSFVFSLVGIIGLICIFSTGCDGGLAVEGIVYEWRDAPDEAKGEIYIDENVPEGLNLEPVSLAHISILDVRKLPFREKEYLPLWEFSANYSGEFSESWISAPFKNTFVIKAEKAGYLTVYKEFEHPNGDFIRKVTVILVRR